MRQQDERSRASQQVEREVSRMVAEVSERPRRADKTAGGAYQPKTGAACGCRRGVMRDNCSSCEGTGWVIDFAAIRARAGR